MVKPPVRKKEKRQEKDRSKNLAKSTDLRQQGAKGGGSPHAPRQNLKTAISRTGGME